MGNKGSSEAKPTLQARIETSGEHVTIMWEVYAEDGKTWQPYKVTLEDLQRASDATLNRLKELEACDWLDISGAEVRPLLLNLAEAGIRQYEVLMTGADNDDKSQKNAHDFREWFEKNVAPNSSEWRIQIVHHQYNAPLISWGLTFTPIPDKDLRNLSTDWNDYQNFWANGFKLACRGALLHEADRLPHLIKDFEAKIAITVEVSDEELLEHHNALDAEDQLEGGEKIANSVRLFEMLSKKYEEHNMFWYVSLEREDNSYVVDDDELTLASIQKARDRTNKIFVMFFDGDSVLRSKRGARWVNEMLDKGRTGMISAEVDIRNKQLTYFGWEFLKHTIYAQKPLIAAVHEAREAYWPRSLLYGVYCDPLHIYFEPPPANDVTMADGFLKSVKSLRQ